MSHPSLRDPAIAPLWEAVRDRLERKGLDNRGQVQVPPLDAAGRLTLKNLLDQARPARRVDLRRLEAALVDLGVGTDLPSALAELGHEVSEEPARRRAERARGLAARVAAREAVEHWPEAWAREWIDGVIRSGVVAGMSPDHAAQLVTDARRVLHAIDQRTSDADAPISRVDLAAQVLGDAHGLDAGRRLESAVTRALVLRSEPTDDDVRVWEAAGVHPDLTSGPVLTWNLPVLGELASVVEAATAAGLPIHLTRFALSNHPPRFEAGSQVLVAENPRVVEAAAQLRSERSVISAGGSPSGAVQLLVGQLLEGGAGVTYHGDFDTTGLALCARMAAMGVRPWRMDSSDYLAALAAAETEGTNLPIDPHHPGPTPWDPALCEVFSRHRRIIHEERLLPGLVFSP